jgi:hypothetical protein
MLRALRILAVLVACASFALLACSPSDPVAGARALLEEGRPTPAIALLRAETEARPGDPHLYLRDRTPSMALQARSENSGGISTWQDL